MICRLSKKPRPQLWHDEKLRARILKNGVDITSELDWRSDKWGARGLFWIKNAEGEWVKPHEWYCGLRDDGLAGPSSAKLGFSLPLFPFFNADQMADSALRFDYEIWYDRDHYDVEPSAEPVEGSCRINIQICDGELGPCPD